MKLSSLALLALSAGISADQTLVLGGEPPADDVNKDATQPSGKSFLRGAGKDAGKSRRYLLNDDDMYDLNPSEDEVDNDVKPVDGYVGVNTGGCVRRNELGDKGKLSLTECTAKCNANDECVSFEYGKTSDQCLLSKSCDRPSLTRNNKSDNHFLYVKSSKVQEAQEVDGYMVSQDTGGCKGRNEIGTFEMDNAEKCGKLCDSFHPCVSFEFGKVNRRCALSLTCLPNLAVSDPDDNMYLYVKED